MSIVHVNNVDLYYELHGPAEAPLLVLNNGILMNAAASWVMQTATLARVYRVLQYDCRGQGQSDHPDGPYTMALHAADLAALLDALEVDSAHIAGASYGGEVAQAFALDYPQRTRSLLLMDTASELGPELRATAESWLAAARRGDADEFYNATVPWNFSPQFIAGHEALLADARRRYGLLDYRAVATLCECFLGVDFTARLGEIAAPTCIVVGEHDLLKGLRYAHILQRGIPHAELHILSGAGHATPWERPAEFNTVVLGFLAKQPQPAQLVVIARYRGRERMRLKDRVCLITGGAAGIGRATAERFAEEGATVIIADLNEEAGRQTAAAIGPAAEFHRVNVADRAAVGAWVDAIVAKYGRVDVLVNNAGVLRDSTLVKVKDGELVKQMPEGDFDLVISVNLKGVFNCAQAVAPHMIRQGGGVILNASSIVGLDGNFGQTNYVATKSAVIGMTKVWARELGRSGIRVNAIAPGFTATEMVAAMPENILSGMRARTPLGRLGEPRDIANAYLFLASDEASFITGEVLRVDGGIVVGT